jgi:uncharacterized membrane protein YgcG
MSDSLPSDEGPGPYEGRGLDDLLSGKSGTFPDSLQQVARTLDALRVAAMPAELGDEAAARAAFRKNMSPRDSKAARLPEGAGGSRTLIPPTGVTGSGARPVPGRHRYRRPPQRWRWQVKAAVGAAAAAVVIIGAAALASTLSGSGERPAAVGRGSVMASTTSPSGASGAHAVDGSARPEPTVKPTPKTSQPSSKGPSASALCFAYFAYSTHPRQQLSAAEKDDLEQLSSLADGGSVAYYCTRLLQWWAVPQRPGSFPGGPVSQEPGDQQGQQGSQGSDQAPGHGTGGNGGNGGGSGGSGGSGGNGGNGGGPGPGG